MLGKMEKDAAGAGQIAAASNFTLAQTSDDNNGSASTPFGYVVK